jgi:hypothetical protein
MLGSMPTSARRAHLVRRLTFLTAICPAIFPTQAQAQEWSGGVGAFVGASFGRKAALAWGFEAFGMRTFAEQRICSNEPLAGVGPLVQLALTGISESRLTLAVQPASN